VTPQYKKVDELTDEQRKTDAQKAWAEMKRLRGV
jgi:hypothetical protein